MAFGPVTLLTISVVVLFAIGALLIRASSAGHVCRSLRWSGSAFLCFGLGFVLILAAPADLHAPVRVVGNAVLLLSYGLLWGAARIFNRRAVAFEPVVAGALAWLILVSLFDPSQAGRVAILSAIVAISSVVLAFEHRQAGTYGVEAQRWAFWIFIAHGGFVLVRLTFGLPFGLTLEGPSGPGLWGAVMALEMILMAVMLGIVSLAMGRERDASLHRQEALEDPLTGIGNRSALFRSGTLLLDAMRKDGRPTALLLMDLDRFKAVNDTHGHPAGDRLLVAFARLAHDYLPPTSLVCRIGGQEFAAILPGADADRAAVVADEIRALFAHLAIEGPQGPFRTTVSIGVATSGAAPATAAATADDAAVEADPDLATLLARADLCLDAAKGGGRDRVVVENTHLARAA